MYTASGSGNGMLLSRRLPQETQGSLHTELSPSMTTQASAGLGSSINIKAADYTNQHTVAGRIVLSQHERYEDGCVGGDVTTIPQK